MLIREFSFQLLDHPRILHAFFWLFVTPRGKCYSLSQVFPPQFMVSLRRILLIRAILSRYSSLFQPSSLNKTPFDLERLIKNFAVRFGIEMENALSLQPQTERGAR